MPEFNTLTAHVAGQTLPGRIQALEGGRGFMRVQIDHDPDQPLLPEGQELELELHDGVRFRVTVTERLDTGPAEYRMKLIGRA